MGRMRAEAWQRVRWEQRQAPVTFVAFDLLFLDGQDLRRRLLLERKDLLRQVLTPGSPVAYSAHVQGDGKALYEAVCERGIERGGGQAQGCAPTSARAADPTVAQMEAARLRTPVDSVRRVTTPATCRAA